MEPLIADVVRALVGLNLNPHPLKAEGAAPNCRHVGYEVGDGGVRDFR